MEKWLKAIFATSLVLAVITSVMVFEQSASALIDPIESSCQENSRSASTGGGGYTCTSGNQTCICTTEGRCDDWDPVVVQCE